ncbi:GNAT family N-acetyltransferase [Spongiimicrobium sp. 3-5]|uniref:GNAT family N-acetyltransferase n=1 Tax=Spongiimicrobium sp. 3-5 TaxID=3332596 RepID=UPI00397F43F6
MGYLLEGEETDRLLFRKVTQTDFDTWLPFHKEPLSTEFWTGIHADPVIACEQQFEQIFYRYKNDLGGMNALVNKTSGKLIGLCGLLIQQVDGLEELEIGYSILPQYWSQGYATEAAIKCKQYAFDKELHLKFANNSLISIIQVDNMASQKVARNNGMFLDKTTRYKDNPVHIFRVKNR